MELETALEKCISNLGIHLLKPKQVEAIKSFVSGKDTFVILPTGYGKSIIYGVLPLLFDYVSGSKGSIAVIVTPLTALMFDQKKRFSSMGLSAEFVGSAQHDPVATTAVLNGTVQLVFISPENLLNNRKFRSVFEKDIYQERMVALVIDEAHCVKLWGDAFRTAFSEIGTLISILPKSVHILALTATATQQTVDCVIERLSMKDITVIGDNIDRSNIKYILGPKISQAEFCASLAEELLSMRERFPKTVLFCHTLFACGEIYTGLKRRLGKNITEPPGLPNIIDFRLINLFTAATTPEMREMVLLEFCKARTILRLVIATSAFGLGVDCPDIARVINWGTPNTIEELVQQTGRAGRDGSNADAILYFRKVDRYTS